jgi:hypothetical protein
MNDQPPPIKVLPLDMKMMGGEQSDIKNFSLTRYSRSIFISPVVHFYGL